jgi:hypothetical protein
MSRVHRHDRLTQLLSLLQSPGYKEEIITKLWTPYKKNTFGYLL